MREAVIQDQIRLELGAALDLVLYRNNIGNLVDGRSGRHVAFGVGGPGGADLIGIFRGRFIAIEIKTDVGRQTPEQRQFEQLVIAKGGEYVVLRSADEARLWLCAMRQKYGRDGSPMAGASL